MTAWLRAAAAAIRDLFLAEECPPDWDPQAWSSWQQHRQQFFAKRRES